MSNEYGNLSTAKILPPVTFLSEMDEKSLVEFPEHPQTLREVVLDFQLPDEIIIDPQGHLFCWVCKTSVDTTKDGVGMHTGTADHLQNLYKIAPTIEQFQSLRKRFNDAVIDARFAIMAREFGGPSEKVDLFAFQNAVKSIRGLTAQTLHECMTDEDSPRRSQNDAIQGTTFGTISRGPNNPQENNLSECRAHHHSLRRLKIGRDTFPAERFSGYSLRSQEWGSPFKCHFRQPYSCGDPYSRGGILGQHGGDPCERTYHCHKGHPRDEVRSYGKANFRGESHHSVGTSSRANIQPYDAAHIRGEVHRHRGTRPHGEARLDTTPDSRREFPFEGEPHLHHEPYPRDTDRNHGESYTLEEPLREGARSHDEPFCEGLPPHGDSSCEVPSSRGLRSRGGSSTYEQSYFGRGFRSREPSIQDSPSHHTCSRGSRSFRPIHRRREHSE